MKKLSVFLALAMLLLYAQDVRGQVDDASSRETLKGLNAIGVQVLSESCAERGYVAGVLQNEAELQLRMAGIKVLSQDAAARATLRVNLFCYELTGNIKGYIVSQDSEVLQWIKWPFSSSSKLVAGITWRSFIFLGVGRERNEAHVTEAIRSSIRQFINAWLAVNR